MDVVEEEVCIVVVVVVVVVDVVEVVRARFVVVVDVVKVVVGILQQVNACPNHNTPQPPDFLSHL